MRYVARENGEKRKEVRITRCRHHHQISSHVDFLGYREWINKVLYVDMLSSILPIIPTTLYHPSPTCGMNIYHLDHLNLTLLHIYDLVALHANTAIIMASSGMMELRAAEQKAAQIVQEARAGKNCVFCVISKPHSVVT